MKRKPHVWVIERHNDVWIRHLPFTFERKHYAIQRMKIEQKYTARELRIAKYVRSK